MDYCNLPLAISAAACAIAKQVNSPAELALLATALRQLAYTLETIALQQEICDIEEE